MDLSEWTRMLTVERSPSAPAFTVRGHPHIHYVSLSCGTDKQTGEPEAVFLTISSPDSARLLSEDRKGGDGASTDQGAISYHAVMTDLRHAGVLTRDFGWHCVALLSPADLSGALHALGFGDAAIRTLTEEAQSVSKRWRGTRRLRLRKELRALMIAFGCPRGFVDETVAKAEKIVRGEISY